MNNFRLGITCFVTILMLSCNNKNNLQQSLQERLHFLGKEHSYYMDTLDKMRIAIMSNPPKVVDTQFMKLIVEKVDGIERHMSIISDSLYMLTSDTKYVGK